MLYDYAHCLLLKEMGLNTSQIASSMDISRSVVSGILKVCEENHITCEIAQNMDVHEIYILIHPEKEKTQDEYLQPDFPYIHEELAKKGVTMKLLWDEYRKLGFQKNKKIYQYSRFCQLYSEWSGVKKVIMRLKHKPGDAMEIDWSGLKPAYLDTDTNTRKEASVFIAVLPYSLDFYWEITRDEKENAVIVALINSFEYFGGVPRLIRPDNMKTAVIKNKRFQIDLNKSLEKLADYYKTAIVPARVLRPRDKSHAEATVKLVENRLIAPLRNDELVDFETLKKKMTLQADALREEIVSVLGTTRRKYYEAEEKPYMKSLPEKRYEPIFFASSTIGHDYLVEVDDNKYSVPYTYVGKRVDVLIYSDRIEVFFQFSLIAKHKRYHEKLRFPVIEIEHMHPKHKAYLEYNKEAFLKYAEGVGPVTLELFNLLFRSCVEPEQVYPFCASLKALGEKYGSQKLENACRQAKVEGKTTDFKLIDDYTKNPDKIPKGKSRKDTLFENQHAAKGFTRGETEYGTVLT